MRRECSYCIFWCGVDTSKMSLIIGKIPMWKGIQYAYIILATFIVGIIFSMRHGNNGWLANASD